MVPLAIVIGALGALVNGPHSRSAATRGGASHSVATPRAVLVTTTRDRVTASAAREFRLLLHRDGLPLRDAMAPSQGHPTLTD